VQDQRSRFLNSHLIIWYQNHLNTLNTNMQEEQQKSEVKAEIKSIQQIRLEGHRIMAKGFELEINDKPWAFFESLENNSGASKVIN
jgi:hypothetical protein